MNPIEQFKEECRKRIERNAGLAKLRGLSQEWTRESWAEKYSYNFTWLGRPIIQLPQDILAVQEIIWEVKPDLIIETGIAHGGSLILSASMLELIGGAGMVVGVDIEIRDHNRKAIEAHPLFKRIRLLEGSSISDTTIRRLRDLAEGRRNVMVFLDSCHTYEHVLGELRLYSEFVGLGSYLVVFDTVVEELGGVPGAPADCATDNPARAVREFLKENGRFEAATEWDHKLLISHNRGGYLRRVA